MPPSRVWRPRTVAATLALLLSVAASAAAQAPSPAQTGRPRIGFALGGGSARGMAHIGVLAWLEEHRVPVDLVAGTSMGGLVAGGYASGMTPDELATLMRTMDWDLVFLSDSPFKYKSFRRKQDAREYPSLIELGLKGGLRVPAGLNAGQQIALALDRIAAPYPGPTSFDDLPIPFRCVAVDLRTHRKVVLDRGPLARALRATMALPGVFTPVAMGDQLLVDGGVLDNVPADVVRAMGADVVIAVNVGASADTPAPQTMFDVMGQAVDVMMGAGITQALADADVVLAPDLGDLTGMDWRRSDDLVAAGYAAAEAARNQLLPYALDEDAWRAWRDARDRRRPAAAPTVVAVRVEGADGDVAGVLARRADKAIVGRPFDPDAAADLALRLAGADVYEVVNYRLEPAAGGTTLVLTGTPKPYGPPFLHPAIELENADADSFALNLRGRAVFMDTPVPGVEIRLDAAAGTRPAAGASLFRHLGRTRFFVEPSVAWGRRGRNVFDGNSNVLASYRETTAGARLDVGVDAGSRSQVAVGVGIDAVRLRRKVGLTILPEASGTNRFVALRWTFDGQTSPQIPTRGIYAGARAAYYFDTPDLQVGETTIEGARDYTQAEAGLSWFHRLAGDHRVFAGASGGTTFGRDPGYNTFELGGLLRLGAYHPGERRGDGYALAQAGVLVRVLRLPDLLGGNGYVGGWIETGTTFDDGTRSRVEWQGSGGVVLETILGPVFMGGSVSFRGLDGRFYVTVGPFFR